MSPAQRKLQHDTHTYIVNVLGQRVAGGELKPGTVLTLADLEDEYAVSRTVIREAVRVLESHGMFVSSRRIGLVVQPRTNWNVLDASVIAWRLDGPERESQLAELMELRSAVEPMAAKLATQRATSQQRQRLTELATTLMSLGRQELGDSDEYLTADIAFHTLLLEASDNPLLMRLADPISEVLINRTQKHLITGVPAPGTLERHVAAAGAIERGDAVAAEEAITQLLQIVASEIRGE